MTDCHMDSDSAPLRWSFSLLSHVGPVSLGIEPFLFYYGVFGRLIRRFMTFWAPASIGDSQSLTPVVMAVVPRKEAVVNEPSRPHKVSRTHTEGCTPCFSCSWDHSILSSFKLFPTFQSLEVVFYWSLYIIELPEPQNLSAWLPTRRSDGRA